MQLQAMAEIAANYINSTNRHIFLTGKAGTGKTTFLKHIVQHTFKHTVVAAPTGIAALNAGGVTLHSLLQLPFGTFVPENIPFHETRNQLTTPETLFRNSKFNSSKRQLIREIELLIIDEVSMLRADLLDCIDHTLRYLRKNNQPFGGLQILFIGDLMQLPPVVKDEERNFLRPYYSNLYFFESRALKQSPPIHVELQKIYRQQDQQFIDLLNRLRTGEQSTEDFQFLNQFYDPEFNQFEEAGSIHLTTHNYRAEKLNQEKLHELDGALHTFYAHLEGTFPETQFPTSPELHLKLGAQVMFIKNDPSGEGLFFNGKIGVVSSLTESDIRVKFEDESEVQVSMYKWENIRYTLDKSTNEIEESFVGSFEQYPIKLAWAVTVHKSQGLTFEKAILDLSGTFAPGQLYVALSRLTSLDGLILSSPLPEDPPSIDPTLKVFNASKSDEKSLRENLLEDQRAFVLDVGKQVFNFRRLLQVLTSHQKSFNKDEAKSQKQKYVEWTLKLTEDSRPLEKVGSGFISELSRIANQENYLDHLVERMTKAESYFIEQITPLVHRVKEHRLEVSKAKKIKGYLKELEEIEDEYIKYIRDIERLCFMVQSLHKGEVPDKRDFQTSKAADLTNAKLAERGKPKTPTAAITYELFKEGKSVQEIAKDRALVVGTIEGHLAQYVENGSIQINELVPSKKVDQIMKVLASDAVGLNEIKSQLPKNYTFGEIKLVMAHQKSKTS